MAVNSLLDGLRNHNPRAVARAISIVEDGGEQADTILSNLDEGRIEQALVIGITGPPGAGKSTLTSSLIQEYRNGDQRLGIVAIDPSSPISGGAILGDRIRMMDHALDPNVLVRSMATRGRLGGLCGAAGAVVRVMATAGCKTIIIETVGVGQSEVDIIRLADITAIVMAPGLGDDIQAMKAGLLEVADLVVVNKADCRGAETLTMEMETLAREQAAKGRNVSVCPTVATSGTGIKELIGKFSELDTEHRNSGERQRRRTAAAELEVLDWAMELLRPRMHQKITSSIKNHKGDPRKKAQDIIAGLLQPD